MELQQERDEMLAETIRLSSDMVAQSQYFGHRSLLSGIWSDDSGSGLIEWILIAALLSLFAVASLDSLTAKIQSLWQGLVSGFTAAI